MLGRPVALLLALACVPVSSGCRRDAPKAARSLDAGKAAPSSSPAASASLGLHPALAGKPPSYWSDPATHPSEDAPVPEHVYGMKVRFDGHLSEKSPCLCSTGTARCGDTTIYGFDWNAIPWAKKAYVGGREARMTLRGVLTRKGLEVTEPPERLPDPKETVLSGALPCAAPPGGFRQRHGRIGSGDFDGLIAYAEAQTDLSHLWHHYHPHVTVAQSRIRPPRPQDEVTVFRFVANADEHRAKLEALWGGPICVVQGGLDREVRDAISARGMRLAGSEGRKNGLLCSYMGGYFDGGTDELHLGATTWNRKMFESWLSQELTGIRVRVESKLDAL